MYHALFRLSDYCSSKWGLMGMHESLRLDLRRHWARSARENKNTGEVGEVGSGDSDSDGTNGGWGVHTLLVCPYATDTGMFKGIFNEESSSASSPSSLSSPSTTSSLVSPWRCVCSVLCLHARAVLIAVMKSVRGVCFPLLRPRQVSDRIIYAIVNKETEVVIPGDTYKCFFFQSYTHISHPSVQAYCVWTSTYLFRCICEIS